MPADPDTSPIDRITTLAREIIDECPSCAGKASQIAMWAREIRERRPSREELEALVDATCNGTAPRTEGLGASRAAMLDLLQAVVREGTGKAARLPNVPAGGKTGTTQEYRDAWFIGFTPDLIVGVWVGNDDNAPMNKVVGGDLPAEIWRDFLSRAAPPLAKDKRQAPAAQAANAPPEAPEPPAAEVGIVRGAPEVMDTGTLVIRGTTVRLEGIQGERGNLARQLARFLRRREVICAPSDAPGLQRCRIGNYNLSAIILAAGGGRATPDASEELQAAEDQARSARLGVWRRGR